MPEWEAVWKKILLSISTVTGVIPKYLSSCKPKIRRYTLKKRAYIEPRVNLFELSSRLITSNQSEHTKVDLEKEL